jgi:hypothetical protein
MSDWQNVATVVILLAAAGYVAWCVARWIRRKGAPDCRCCSKRPTGSPKRKM